MPEGLTYAEFRPQYPTLVGNPVAVQSDDDNIMRPKSFSVKRMSQPMEENR